MRPFGIHHANFRHVDDTEIQLPWRLISPSAKLRLLALAWIITAVSLVIILWGALQYAPMFPVLSPPGFFLLVCASGSLSGDSGFYLVVTVGWTYYLLLTLGAGFAKTRSRFIWVYTILCISLMLNLGGCEAAKHMSWNMGCKAPTKMELARSR
jgi:hypothetical protein